MLFRFATYVTLFSAAFAAPVIESRSPTGFGETVPGDSLGELYLKHQPFLKVFHGCVPWPAVDAEGNTHGGLKPTGSSSGQCGSNPGQVYARKGTRDGKTAIMYAWYMPKDSPSPGLGHRHDWEAAVVWLNSDNPSESKVDAVSVSGHGKYEVKTDGIKYGGGHDQPLIGYNSFWPVNHQLVHTDEQGGQQPLVAWESLPDAARKALEETDFGSANVPFINREDKFKKELEKAKY